MEEKKEEWYIKYMPYILFVFIFIFLCFTLPNLFYHIKKNIITKNDELEKSKIVILLPDMQEVYNKNVNIIAGKFCYYVNDVESVKRDNKYNTLITCKDGDILEIPLETVINLKLDTYKK